jgi:hypothetical protein
MKNKNLIILSTIVFIFLPMHLNAQSRITARGNAVYQRIGIHDGNNVHTVFTNYGVIAQPSKDTYPRGAWKYDSNGYIGDVSPLVGILNPIKKYKETDTVPDTIHTVVITDVDRPGGHKYSPGGTPWTFQPIPGFSNPAVGGTQKGVAMSDQPDTWPSVWPDYPSWTLSDVPFYVYNGDTIRPTVDWNGYFGRGKGKAAAQESYFWMDDNYDTQMYDTYGFIPDTNDASRRGHALQVSVRGMQWGSDPVSSNVLFWLYNIKNDGTTTYDQTVFGLLVGTYVGIRGDEYNDDASFFDVRESITYTWDFDNYIRPAANPAWVNPSSVGYVAYAFLESPGNGVDGIDNDHDNASKGYSLAPYFVEDDFKPRVLKTGDKYVLIDKSNHYQRTVKTVGVTTDTVYSMGVKFVVYPGATLPAEGNILTSSSGSYLNPNAIDGIDNNLNGLIDESFTTHYKQYKTYIENGTVKVLIDTLNATQHFDYINNIGLSDWMIDEKRDDGIDNDRDWSALTDDVGADGKDSTHDAGEYDGIPTEGEPNFDSKDVHESDQLGLTSFEYFVPADQIKMSDNEDMWKRMQPGYFAVPTTFKNNQATKGEDGDFIYASGYFPLQAGQTERFSLALAYGTDLKDVMRTKRIVQIIYNANYQYAQPPLTPTLTVVPGDGRVTLYWDRVAENSVDPLTKEKDFEGYKIYKSTSYDFKDQYTITDATGKDADYQPYVTFDLNDGITGPFVLTDNLRVTQNGYAPYLGDDSGIQNSFVDTAVTNGRTYYYVIASYDRGDAASESFPARSTIDGTIKRDLLGNFTFAQNAGSATPAKPVAGYVAPSSGLSLKHTSGPASGGIYYEVVDPYKLKNAGYTVTFANKYLPEVHGTDTTWQGPVVSSFSVQDSASQNYVVKNSSLITPFNSLVFDGIRLSFDTTYQSIDSSYIKTWAVHNVRDSVTRPLVKFAVTNTDSVKIATNKYLYMHKLASRDYDIVFDTAYTYSSDTLYGLFGTGVRYSPNINFRIFDVTDNAHPFPIRFAFSDADRDSNISARDVIYLCDSLGTKAFWKMSFTNSDTVATHKPYRGTLGDTIKLRYFKQMTASDVFSFEVDKASYNSLMAAQQMHNIKAVPNPYVVTNLYETASATGYKGRGERVIRFNNLPLRCKIYIYTSSGDLVRTLDHNDGVLNGSEKWDLRTKEGLDIAYGVYFYVVEAEGISELKTGKLAIIK